MRNLSPIWKVVTSLKITITCLFILFILTAWGTYYQSEYGLYAAQNKFFYSFFFLIEGFLPLPGAQLVLWLLSINLLSDALFHFKRRIKRSGIFLIHWGIIILLFGSFFTYNFAQESYLALYENEESNVSTDYRKWEVAIWKKNNTGTNNVFAYTMDNLYTGDKLYFPKLNLYFRVISYFENARIKTVTQGEKVVNENIKESIKNASGISSLIGVKESYDPSENLPGIILEGQRKENFHKEKNIGKMLLWGGEIDPYQIEINDEETISIHLRRIRYPLPVSIELKNFTKQDYTGTKIAKNYESLIKVKDEDIKRDVRVYMNNPFRYNDFTFYQASYQIDPDGKEKTVLAVVKNVGRLLPYFSSGVIFVGLAIHFLLILGRFISYQKRGNMNDIIDRGEAKK